MVSPIFADAPSYWPKSRHHLLQMSSPGSKNDPQTPPWVCPGSPSVPKSAPRGAQGGPKVPQGDPKGAHKSPKASPKAPQRLPQMWTQNLGTCFPENRALACTGTLPRKPVLAREREARFKEESFPSTAARVRTVWEQMANII